MLSGLRRRLALLNAVLSGVLLLSMAFAGLAVTERQLTQQGERDLTMYTESLLEALLQSHSGGAEIQTRVPGDYIYYWESDQLAQLVFGDAADADIMSASVKKVRDEVALQIYSQWGSEPNPDMMQNLKAAQLYIRAPQADGRPAIVIPPAFMISRTKKSMLIADDTGASFRVSVTVLGTTPPQLMLVLQNRGQELGARNRLRMLFFGSAALGLVLVGLASLFVSSRSIRPVEESIKRQREFVAAASHELRSPVAAVRANADVLADAPLGDFAPFLESIRLESERMTRLVTDLLVLARADAGEMRVSIAVCDVSEVAAQVIAAMSPLAVKKEIELHSSLDPAMAMGDALRLKQALTILVDNAIRYTPDGGNVRVGVRQQGASVMIAVADTGMGIPDEIKSRVFDRFYRGDAARTHNDGGTGLGLSIARQLVTQMNGTLTLEDNPGGGSVFELRLKVP